MSRTVFCKKLGKEGKGLDIPPYPGEIGKKIFESISEEAWQLWLKHQTMLINEKRLSMIDPAAREYLLDQMNKFLFSGDYEMPEGYTPPDESSEN